MKKTLALILALSLLLIAMAGCASEPEPTETVTEAPTTESTSEATTEAPREASEMFQCIKYEDKREVFGLKIHSFSTLDRIKKYDDSDNGKSAEKPYSIEVGEIERTINLYAIASTKFQVAV